MPEIQEGQYLIDVFFEFGPATKDGPVEAGEVLKWAEVMGVQFKPWQARLFIRLSREYCMEQQTASVIDAEPPWAGAAEMWKWVCAKRNETRVRENLRQETPKNGNRQRR